MTVWIPVPRLDRGARWPWMAILRSRQGDVPMALLREEFELYGFACASGRWIDQVDIYGPDGRFRPSPDFGGHFGLFIVLRVELSLSQGRMK